MSYFNIRRQVSIVLLFFLVLFSFAAYSSNLWIQWTFLAVSLFVLILVDFIFLSDNTFVYDPSYKSWGIKTGSSPS